MDERFEKQPQAWQLNGYATDKGLQQTPPDGKGWYVWEGISETLVKYPATTVAIFDAMPDTIASFCPDLWPWEDIGEWKGWDPLSCNYTSAIVTADSNIIKGDQLGGAKRHNGGANYLFVDGHVKWYKPEQISANANTGNRPAFRL